VRLYWLIFLPAALYQCLAILSALLHLRKRAAKPPQSPPAISVLKPLRGLDPNTYPAFVSQV
jgi:hypothetical protein